MDEAIKNTLAMIRKNAKVEDILKCSEAVLNLAHAKQILEPGTKSKGGAGS
jgi:hypothetical protein